MISSQLKIIESENEWKEFLSSIDAYDFYHTYDYHQLAKVEGETPIIVVYQNGNCFVGIPFLQRKIFDTNYNDLTSVYGYAGPLYVDPNDEFQQEDFKQRLNDFFIENNIVSVFSRLNPFIPNQENIISGLGDVLKLSKVVNIDITKPKDEQRTIFSKTTKRYVNKTRKLCDIKIGGTPEDIETFKDLYYENMDRVNAKDSYYFDIEYFEKITRSDDFQNDVLFAILKETGEIISAAMMIKTNDIIQYHISGTRDQYLHLTPIRILIDEMRILGTDQGYTYFNLGGGLGSTEDSLFKFKSSFSKDFKDFKIWKYIVNDKIYNELSEQFSDKTTNRNFFPLYRNN